MTHHPIVRFCRATLCIVLCMAMHGCATSYYKVTDLSSGTVYHTTGDMAERYEYSGALRFIDGASNSEITLLNSSVTPITREQYEAAVQSATAQPDS